MWDFKSINVYYRKGVKITFFLCIFIFLLSSQAWARTIWKIGLDNRVDEFGLPGWDPNLDKDFINYQVPKNWNEVNWKSFPTYLWPSGVQFNPIEIHITYNYPKEYRDPILRIKAKSAVKNYSQRLIIEKGCDPNVPIGMADLPSQFTLFEFPLGYIRKGLDERNKIILKNQAITNDDYLYFDYLELDDQDQDGDGSLDSEEPEGDIDEDGIENMDDPDTATLFIRSWDGLIIKRITLDIQEQEEPKPFFTGLNLMDTNSPAFSTGLPGDVFFQFGFFKAAIQIPGEEDTILLHIIYPEDKIIYETARFYLYTGSGDWEDIPFEIIDENIISIFLEVNKEGRSDENRYSQEDTAMTIIGGLAYPEGVGINLDASKCFIGSLPIR